MENTNNCFVEYIVPDKYTEENSMKRLQFYTFFPKEPNKFYFGLSFREPVSKEILKRWVKEGKLIELLEPVKIQKEKDLWLDSKGNIFSADAVNPIQDNRKEHCGKYKQFTKAYQLAHKFELPKIENYHVIEE
jgi:hypothetical protein